MRFEQFTQSLKQVVINAQSKALGLDHTAIYPVHLLDALLQEPAQKSLYEQAGADGGQLQSKIQEALGRLAVQSAATGEVQMSPEAGKIMNLVDRYAQKAGDAFIATEWLALVLAEQGDTQKILASAGLKLQPELQSKIIQLSYNFKW